MKKNLKPKTPTEHQAHQPAKRTKDLTWDYHTSKGKSQRGSEKDEIVTDYGMPKYDSKH